MDKLLALPYSLLLLHVPQHVLLYKIWMPGKYSLSVSLCWFIAAAASCVCIRHLLVMLYAWMVPFFSLWKLCWQLNILWQQLKGLLSLPCTLRYIHFIPPNIYLFVQSLSFHSLFAMTFLWALMLHRVSLGLLAEWVVRDFYHPWDYGIPGNKLWHIVPGVEMALSWLYFLPNGTTVKLICEIVFVVIVTFN